MAQAWGQESWPDHSGVSRTMSVLTEEEAAKYAAILGNASQSLIDSEVQLALSSSGRLVLDGDLTPRPVSNSSTSYPGASYGYMDGKLQLGYQAAIITMHSPTYGRLGLSASRQTGKTVSATQAELLVLEAERRLGRQPWRRTDLLSDLVFFCRFWHLPMYLHKTYANGTIPAVNERMAEQVKPVTEDIRTYLIKTEEPVHFDETGVKISGKLHWLHSAGTKVATFCHIHAKRGAEAMDAIGILPKRTGWSIHDFWKPYLKYQQARHALCNAHLIRLSSTNKRYLGLLCADNFPAHRLHRLRQQ